MEDAVSVHDQDYRDAAALATAPLARDSMDEGMERVIGIEPTTSSLGSWRSTTELHPQQKRKFPQWA
ncbi:hypothetical protein EMEDMD4_10174 [Sinorhizobium medicae]|uniref:Uncharacterized protein n=1 Tax=Sinorhizobium medicae TaxID=110321 RepID=A0A508WN66_9HYPH|nr:hypothetical protein EMEDMD4_10174 [Sinorhizobium medicae]